MFIFSGRSQCGLLVKKQARSVRVVLLQSLKGRGSCVHLSAAIFPKSFYYNIAAVFFFFPSPSCELACLTVPSLTDEFFLRIS